MKSGIKNITKRWGAAASLLMIAAQAFGAGTGAAQFLKLGAGARASAMGNAYSSVADDVTATYWNPAGLAKVETPEIGAMQNTHLVETNYQYLAGALPAAGSVFGLSLYRMDYGTIERTSNLDVKDGEFDAASLAASLSIGRKLNNHWMVGASLKHISESIETEQATSFAADLGILYKFNQTQLSAMVQHMGPGMKMVNESAPLPLTFRLGASTHFSNKRLLVAVEASKPNDATVSFHAGLEYRLLPLLALRGGYILTPGQSSDLGGLVGLNAGLGVSFNRFNLDYAVSPFGDLGLSHRLSIGLKFGTQQPN